MKKILVSGNKYFFLKDLSKDFHCQYGLIKSSQLKKAKVGDEVETNTGRTLRVLDSSFIDIYGRIKRGPQIIPRKDIGVIINMPHFKTKVGKTFKLEEIHAAMQFSSDGGRRAVLRPLK